MLLACPNIDNCPQTGYNMDEIERRRKMKKMKKIFVICVAIMLWLSACGNNGAEERTYTYEDLNSEQQSLIDNIYENYSIWESVFDSGRDIMVDKVNFLYEDDTLLFVTYYDEGDDGVGCFYKIMEVGKKGDLTGHIYENTLFNEEEKANERKATMAAFTGFIYPLGQVEQKNVLANAFYKVLVEKDNK